MQTHNSLVMTSMRYEMQMQTHNLQFAISNQKPYSSTSSGDMMSSIFTAAQAKMHSGISSSPSACTTAQVTRQER